MDTHELHLLTLAAAGGLLFHKGTWGGPPGYQWCDSYGEEAGCVPPQDCHDLDALADRGLIGIEHRLGPLPCHVFPTDAGLRALGGALQAA